MPIFPGHHLVQHHLPGQHQPAGVPLQVPQEQRGLPGEETRLQHRQRDRLSVQFRLLSANGRETSASFWFSQNLNYFYLEIKMPKEGALLSVLRQEIFFAL